MTEQKAEINKDELDDLILEIEDDTPPEDRGREPMPKEVVQELENDELEEYSDKVKVRMKQLKKVYHDERREKERALREQQEAVVLARKLLEENKSLKTTLSKGEKTLVDSYKQSTELELNAAKTEYKKAYEAGNADELLAAQERLTTAKIKSEQLSNYKPSLQEEENTVDIPATVAQKPQLDQKTLEWTKKNTWWGHPDHADMTALALATHTKLEQQKGAGFVGTDDYWKEIDTTMKRRFPEMYEEEETDEPQEKIRSGGGKPEPSTVNVKSATVVAPASRSTASKKVRLKQSQITLAKKLGLTPEQYAKEVQKLEAANG